MGSMRLPLTFLFVITELIAVTPGAHVAQEKPRSHSHENDARPEPGRLLRTEGAGRRHVAVGSDGATEKEQASRHATHSEDADVYVEVDGKGRGGDSEVGRSRDFTRTETHARGLSSRKLMAHAATRKEPNATNGTKANGTKANGTKANSKTTTTKPDAENEEESTDDDDPVQDCAYNDWQKWSECTETCGGGSRHRTRTVKTEAANGGQECKQDEKKQTEDCHTQECPVDCVISDWQEWGKCAPDCSGKRARSRTLIQQATHGGEACGETNEEESCDGVCTDCEYQDWGAWAECSATCGGGTRPRAREVAVPATNGGKVCQGAAKETEDCGETPCPVDCEANDWSDWSHCVPFCAGNRTRERTVKTKAQNGGKDCGDLEDFKACSNYCLDCQWEDWSDWTTCSATCAGGKFNRTRSSAFLPHKAEAAAGGSTAKAGLLELPEEKSGFEIAMGKKCSRKAIYAKPWAEVVAICTGTGKNADNCHGIYDPGCDKGQVFICRKSFVLEPEEDSCTYTKKDIGRNGTECSGEPTESKECNTEVCPVDCVYSDWGTWSPCAPYCAGTQTRSRAVVKPAVGAGEACVDEALKETQNCSNVCVDCVWGNWSEWETCPVTCGGGKQKHNRSVAVAQQGKGKNCTGPAEEEQSCNQGSCPVDCAMSDWTAWTTCEPFCSGFKKRSRMVTQPPLHGGQVCGNLTEDKACGNFCMDCQVSDWTTWTSCTKSCAGGISNRTRTEVYVQRPNASGASLLEMTALGYEKKLGFRCTTVSMLPAAAGLSPAAGEALCSEDPECLALYDEGCHGVVTVCKGGTLEEEQGSCTYTKKEIGQGRPCDGNISQAQKCNKQECPVDCVVSDWGTWTVCEPFCEGQQSRNRTVKVEAAFGGVACPALNEAQSCNNTCLDCLWSDWAEWSVCTASCEGGKQGRARSVARAKVGVAADCEGPEEQSQKCNEMSCPVDCELTDWTGWSSCHPYCIGTQNRSRTVKISNDFGGAPCGNLADEKSCTNFCMDCQLSEWTEWSDCTKTCASGSSSREREEVYVQRKPKPSFLQLQEGAASSTGAWGYQKKLGFRCDEDHQRSLDGASPQDAEALCSADPTCGGLYDKGCDNWVTICNKNFIMEAEEGSCIYQKQEIGQGEPCEGYISETMKCNEEKCPVDCVMSEWTDWTVCEPFCEGSHTKTREITTQPAFGGAPCGLTKKEETCSNFCVDCEWSDWSEWEACTVSCAGGKTQRNRTIAVPKQGGGKECVGVTQETASCKEQECPIDCEFSGWSLWSPCEPYCEGTQQRNRNITVEPAFGGVTCLAAAKAMSEGLQGVTRQTRECSNLCRDCDWLDWTPFGSCSVSCGGGNKQRFRDQLFVKRSSGAPGEEPAFAPAPVYGFELKMNFRCAENSRREGILSMAAAREVCSTDPNCGGVYDEGCDGSAVICEVGFGLHDEEGSCIHNKLEIGGGSECEVQETKQTEQCGTGECPIDCMYSDWTTWTLCEPHCNGTQTRGREILRLAEHGGEACQGTAESQTCSNFCVHCRWAEWSAWSTCSVSCAGGSQTRTRTEAVPKAGGGEACEGKGAEVRVCGDLNCPVDCVVSDWTAWSPCKPYCHGLQNRSRATVTPARFGGAPCGELAEERACANLCLDCQLSGWDEWAACSSSCGGGSRHRLRSETYVARNRSNTSGASLLEVSSQAIGYEKKMGVRCDEAHQRKLHVAAPGAAQEACSSDPSCGGVYDHGCQNFWAICDVGYVLESEEGSCSYMKKEIGQGEACEGNVAQDEDCNDQLCPVDCVYTEWTAWSPCEPYCSGMSNRTRNITKEPLNGGEPCNRVAEVSNCSNTCVDCEWHSWTAWSDCTASCDGGSRLRVRSVAVQQDGGGLKCSGNDTQVEDCNDKIACPVDCQITDWSGWTPCTPFCSGKQQRSRSIIAQPFAGGAACGETGEEVNCTNACVDCVVSAWTDWSECSATCSGGSQHRSRGVVTHAQGQGLPCPEKLQQTKEDMCAPMDCPVDCQWGDWTPWNGCTATCGEGTQDRTRDEVVSAAFGGLPCEGSSREWKACVMEICPMDCQWGEWSAWGNCSTSCDSGFQRRNRSVAFPKVGEGADCDGHDEDAQPCSQRGCPRDCILHDWQDWSECSATCGPGGKRKRIRDAESEIEGGRPCNESNEEFEACGLEGCPRNCIWGDWGGWSNCTKSCGKGIAFRERVQIVTAAFGGSCDGSAVQTDFCNKVPCPEDCIWNDWGRWSSCSEACGSSVAGTKTRLRTKSGPYNAGEDCIGFPTETAPCNAPGGCSVNCSWEVWSPWTACSRSCSTGTRSRHRSVDTEAYGPLGRNCTGEPLQEEACDTHTHCPIDCEFEDWADWGSCQLQPCGSAKRLRSREKGVAQFGGAPCMGNTSEVEDCEVPGAPPVVPCNASVPFGNVPEAAAVTKPPAGSAEANPPPGPWEAAEQAAKAAKEQGLSAEEQVAAAGAAAAAALGGSATVAAEAAMAAAKVSGAAPNRQVELAAEAAAAAAARASGGNASHAAQEAANAASVVAKQANLTAAEEASIAATAARESASESGASVESVATAAAQVAKEEGATPQEAAAAAAVAAADAAKKQGANPAQSAEVAVAAAKAAGTSQQEQSAAAAMAYTRAGGTGTLNLTKLGLGPVARRVNVTEEQAEEIAEKEPESVQGSESLQVSDPETFMHDTAALEAARDALGAQLGVDPDAIVIVDAQPVAATANSASMLEMARKVSSMARRQAPSSGEVNISYKVVPSVSGKTNEEVVNAVQHLDSAEASKKVEQVFAEKKLSYQVSVASMELSVTNKEKGVTKEEATLTEKRSGASRSSMATLIAMLGSLSLM